ncbi:MAG TPA: hypothetical protein VGQ91_04305, partial [Ideonella sp.]|nr:hypothetical protein [Ideonella sp.]
MRIHRKPIAGWRVGAAAALLSGLLAGCGGGGGGGDERTTSGLVPAAPTPGATLFADATVLRPLVPGASWSYSGTDPDG